MAKRVFESLPDLSKARDRVAKPNLIYEDVVVSPRVKEFAKGRKFLIKTFGIIFNRNIHMVTVFKFYIGIYHIAMIIVPKL